MKPWQYWISFVVCLALVFSAMGWVTMTAVRLDKSQAEIQQQSAFEENVRLALWRMETEIAPMLAQESARPYFVYAPFYPAEQAYNKMFEEIDSDEVMIPSPLLTEKTPHVVLHFQIDPASKITSPQVPANSMKKLSVSVYDNGSAIKADEIQLERFKKAVNPAQLLSALPPSGTNIATTTNMLYLAEANYLRNAANPVVNNEQSGQLVAGISRLDNADVQQAMPQQAMNSSANDWQMRAQQQVETQLKGQRSKPSLSLQKKVTKGRDKEQISRPRIQEGMMSPLWLGDMLILARRVTVNGGDYVQGCWLDWPAVKKELLDRIKDLFPGADLQPLNAPGNSNASRVLAGLPVQLMPGGMPASRWGGTTPVQFSLIIAWCCVLVGALAVGVLMAGAVSLSERRGDFVSAVTHELRTPLTTFRMYAEMLAEGMVTDETKRRHYLQTLCAESNRLSHLVENVLSYARLERGKKNGHVENVSVDSIVARAIDRLKQRAEQAGMKIEWEPAGDAGNVEVRTDISAVEQILFNLVDNACKYAVVAKDKRIHIEAVSTVESVFIRIRDHGHGITAEDGRRLFKPFSKSAKHAAESAPGVGLGLALSRRLARQMHGDLKLDPSAAGGACFELRLPRVA